MVFWWIQVEHKTSFILTLECFWYCLSFWILKAYTSLQVPHLSFNLKKVFINVEILYTDYSVVIIDHENDLLFIGLFLRP